MGNPFKKIGKFFKKNLRDIATVVGFVIGGPAGSAAAGAAIGQGVGSLAEGRSVKDSLVSGAKIYGAGSIAEGAGWNQPGTNAAGATTPRSVWRFGDAMVAPYDPITGTYGKDPTSGIGGTFQDIGAGGRNLLLGKTNPATGKPYTFAEALGKDSALAGGWGDLGWLGKAGVIGTGMAGIGALDAMDDTPAGKPDWFSGGGNDYLTRGLTPATISDVYGTAGIPRVARASAMPEAIDPITQTYLEMLMDKEKDYGTLAFPQFDQQPLLANEGGIARLADGGKLPEIDLREHGGVTYDAEGSGDEDTIPALLADGEFVMTKQAVKGMGNGDHDQGIAMLYAMMNQNERKAQNMGIGRV
jgi:hypothetical protein